MVRRLAFILGYLALAAVAAGAKLAALQAGPSERTVDAVAELVEQAERLSGLVTSAVAREFLAATPALPSPGARTVYRDRSRGPALSEAEFASVPEGERPLFERRVYDEKFYYFTGYGSPLVFARPLDIVAERAGWTGLGGKRVVEFGYGSIGQLRLMASCGADVVGVDVEPVLSALYSGPGDTGTVACVRGGGECDQIGARVIMRTRHCHRFGGLTRSRAPTPRAWKELPVLRSAGSFC